MVSKNAFFRQIYLHTISRNIITAETQHTERIGFDKIPVWKRLICFVLQSSEVVAQLSTRQFSRVACESPSIFFHYLFVSVLLMARRAGKEKKKQVHANQRRKKSMTWTIFMSRCIVFLLFSFFVFHRVHRAIVSCGLEVQKETTVTANSHHVSEWF